VSQNRKIVVETLQTQFKSIIQSHFLEKKKGGGSFFITSDISEMQYKIPERHPPLDSIEYNASLSHATIASNKVSIHWTCQDFRPV
jgi:hypothetical protein